jgi:hypothetical protein
MLSSIKQLWLNATGLEPTPILMTIQPNNLGQGDEVRFFN